MRTTLSGMLRSEAARSMTDRNACRFIACKMLMPLFWMSGMKSAPMAIPATA